MNSAGDDVEDFVVLLRVLMSTRGLSDEGALAEAGHLIPAEMHDRVLQRYREQTSTTIEVLRPTEFSSTGGPQPWYQDWNSAEGYYWLRQRRFLAHDLRRMDFEIDSLDIASDRVLAHLGDPGAADPFDIRGLVVGHVQSGKTANFSALIAKAADAGYRIVIVLSGLHNSLRMQTQRRLQRDLGHEDTIGVGLPTPGNRWVWMTNGEPWGDFDAAAVNGALLQGNDHVILVLKKNKSRLDRLLAWMRGRVPDHVPVLIIDDEADQASVNTGGNRAVAELTDLDPDDYDGDAPAADELDPSAINLRIRQLLNLFARSSYVAYTATPFANVLIDPSASDADGGDDLFPRDFIISLPSPPGGNYVGAERLFGRDRLAGEGEITVEALDVIEIVPDHEIDYVVPPRGERDTFIPAVPPSLRQALVDYLLGAAGWLHRAGRDEPCTMLVHTDMRRAVQNPLAEDIRNELAVIRQQWRYEREVSRPAFVDRWNREFRPVTVSLDVGLDVAFESIEPYLDDLLRDGIPVRVLNSDHLDTADFDAEPTLKAVLVGGNKLSRGVTIEGLITSFYVRETLYYDTLMQMGRWFGYRGRYVDLTRLYSTQLLVSCFHDLATAEQELRNQIALYETQRLTPREFVPKVRMHPTMLVTAPNKMRAAEELSLDYSGQRVQTVRIIDDRTTISQSLKVTREFLNSLGSPQTDSGRPFWTDIPAQQVLRFLGDFPVFRQPSIDPQSVLDYIQLQVRNRELTRWRVLLSAAQAENPELGSDDLGVVGRPEIALKARTRLAKDPTSLGVVTEPEDDLFGLEASAIAAARAAVGDGNADTLAAALRMQRDAREGYLVLYPISAQSQPRSGSSTRIPLYVDSVGAPTVIAYQIQFPASSSDATVEYVSAPQGRR
ncbi:Z1 domain-containing protein [Blastococcus sp. CT_GayMR16]|uniref:Z1 domain-containing protein n=1 Tax=Blastococcus sp. CT_GayMR16 TaxID=2559607 RepID=UPI0010733690|nr:Z1 domain-containing protein [Blastococcus sp. CT_GayMR16]TFV87403.1 hypothetical protein E4P38_13975 [Blastococcus sp. CT_GayMR16]